MENTLEGTNISKTKINFTLPSETVNSDQTSYESVMLQNTLSNSVESGNNDDNK